MRHTFVAPGHELHLTWPAGAVPHCNLLEGRIKAHSVEQCVVDSRLMKPASSEQPTFGRAQTRVRHSIQTAIIKWPLLPHWEMMKGHGEHASRRFHFVRKQSPSWSAATADVRLVAPAALTTRGSLVSTREMVGRVCAGGRICRHDARSERRPCYFEQ